MILLLVQEYYERKMYKVCYLCRESRFSEEIGKGIKNYYSTKPDVHLDFKIIPRGTNEVKEFIRFLQKETKLYNGLIIRPLEISNELFLTVQSLIRQKKEVVLVDLNFTEDQVSNSPLFNLPVYIGSDFSKGDKLVAKEMISLAKEYGKEETNFLILLGPESVSSVKKRGRSIVWGLAKNGYADIATFLTIDSFNVEDCAALIEEKLRTLDERTFKGKHFVIFCANDNIALELMRKQVTQEDSMLYKFSKVTESIYYIGYDGIKDVTNGYMLDRYPLNYTTIDVLPEKQGEKAAKDLLEALDLNEHSGIMKHLISPKVISNTEKDHKEHAKS